VLLTFQWEKESEECHIILSAPLVPACHRACRHKHRRGVFREEKRGTLLYVQSLLNHPAGSYRYVRTQVLDFQFHRSQGFRLALPILGIATKANL
jgi:hypothetical protein